MLSLLLHTSRHGKLTTVAGNPFYLGRVLILRKNLPAESNSSALGPSFAGLHRTGPFFSRGRTVRGLRAESVSPASQRARSRSPRTRPSALGAPPARAPHKHSSQQRPRVEIRSLVFPDRHRPHSVSRIRVSGAGAKGQV